MMSKTCEWYMSCHPEQFSGPAFETREAAIEAGHGEYPGETIWIAERGKSITKLVAECDVADVIIEHIDCSIYDRITSDEPFVTLTRDKKQELNQLVSRFLLENAEIQSGFELINDEEIPATESEAE